MYKKLLAASGIVLMTVMLAGCGSKKKEEGPAEQELTAVSLQDLEEGQFYVKSGDSFWKLPYEESNIEFKKEPQSTDGKTAGMMATGIENNRILDFVYQDNAIPTLYKNDVLVYVSKDSISSFTWERFQDCGYSIGIYGFEENDADKITTGELSNYAVQSSVADELRKNQIPSLGGIVFDKINGTPITSSVFNESAGIITGMSKDAPANIDAYIGTQHIPMTAKADTRYFQSFELFNSTQYSLSTDGYAVVEVPSYLKSGYYFINNTGLVKFVNIDRGNDEASIDMAVPYYYLGDDGKVMTYFEWRESQGLSDEGLKKDDTEKTDVLDVSDYPERMKFTTDSSAIGLNVEVDYTYKSDSAKQNASQTGEFPKAILMDPYGEITPLAGKEDANEDGSYTVKTTLDSAPCGDWYVLFRNFDDTYKTVSTELISGNATTYIHNGKSGNITIYYEASATPKTLHVTWEQSDRTATGAAVTAPDGTSYDLSKNPEMFNSFAGGIDITLPLMVEGNYRIDLKGDALGRVWVTRENPETSDETAPETVTSETVENTES